MLTSGSKQVYYINSGNRISGSDSDFTYRIDFPRNTEYTHVVLLDISIPKSFYLVQDGYNTFTLDEDGKTATITLTSGNYSLRSLQATLTTLLNTGSPNGWTYAVSYPNADTVERGKMTFTVSGNSGVQPSFILTTNLHHILGFSSNTTNTFVGDTLTSTNVINLQKETTLYLHSNLCMSYDNDILSSIYANDDADFSNITVQNMNAELTAKPLKHTKGDVYYFKLINHDGEVVELNGQSMLFTIACFQQSPITKLIQTCALIYTLRAKEGV